MRAAAAVALAVVVTSCAGGGEEPDRPQAKVNPALPAATALTDPATPVPAGTFGVVKTHGSTDNPPDGVVALKVGPVRRGEAGDFEDVRSLDGGSAAMRQAVQLQRDVELTI